MPDARINSGPGRTLTALYAIFALAATGRSAVQLLQHFDQAPLAYILSALAALIYVAATTALVIGDRTRNLALAACLVELVGVITIGTTSYTHPHLFPDKTVWSHFGQGYAYLPALLPVLGLTWLRRTRPTATLPSRRR